jgi:hypothetical protein
MMTTFKKLALCLAGGLMLNTGLRADDVLLPGNPYAPVVVRNIFGLNPPTPVDTSTTVEPPVQITPNGIMSIFGQLQVLFKVAGKPAGKDSYILTEGQRQDDIEVVKIDEKAGIVTFNNHGIVQALPLVPAMPSSTPAPAPSFGSAIPSPAMQGIAPGGNNGFSRFGNRGGNFPGRNRGGNNGGDNSGGGNDGSGLRSVPTRGGYPSQSDQQSQLSREEQVIMIEANRAATAQQVENGTMPPLPPTELTPPEATAAGGSPLVVPEK